MPYQIEHIWNTSGNKQILINTDNGQTWEWDDSQVAHGIGPTWKPVPLQPHGAGPSTHTVVAPTTSNVLLVNLLKRAIVLCRSVMRGYNYQPTDLDTLENDAKNAGVVVP